MNKIRILVTATGAASIGSQCIKTLRLSKLPYRIIGTDTTKESLGLVKCDKFYVVPKASHLSYIHHIMCICIEEGIQIIIPGSTPELIALAHVRKLFEDRGILVLANNLRVINTCENKFETYKFLINNGFKAPKSHMLNYKKWDLDYPVIIKPNCGGGGSRGIYIVQNPSEMIFFRRILTRQGIFPMAQEYIGSPDEEYTIGVLHSFEGKLLGSIVLKRKVDAPLSTYQVIHGNNEKVYTISSGISQGYIDDFDDVRKNAEEIAEKIGSTGPLNIQCRKTVDGIFTFEINPRFSGTLSIRALCGFNELETLIRVHLLKEKVEKMTYKKGLVLRGLENYYIGD